MFGAQEVLFLLPNRKIVLHHIQPPENSIHMHTNHYLKTKQQHQCITINKGEKTPWMKCVVFFSVCSASTLLSTGMVLPLLTSGALPTCCTTPITPPPSHPSYLMILTYMCVSLHHEKFKRKDFLWQVKWLLTFNSFPAIKFRGRFPPTRLPLIRVRYHVILRVN